ncbi:MAG: carboxypeptidase regulatory-like domain-containing protein [Bryobacterales bacterium]|nr:carboxypeptidase regulatory-like domain-containing protein [Bryobacterales bacterium]
MLIRLLLLITLFTAQSFAQAIFGSIQGTVSDETGAVVPNVRITARNVNTGVAVTVQTNDRGLYFLGELRPGQYDVEAESAGFQKMFQRGLSLRIEDHLRADFIMKVGQVTESVEVTSETQLIQTENNTLGRVMEENTIKQLPLRGRNAFELVLLAPGAQQRGDDGVCAGRCA